MADKPGLQVGEVEVTDAGELKAKHIVHIVCPIWFDGAHKEPEKLAQCVLNALKKCDELEAVKISIPSLTSGIYGFPRDLCAKIVTESALKYFDQVTETKIKTINFVNTDVATTKEFESKLKQNIDNVVRLT
jgi:putative ATPase